MADECHAARADGSGEPIAMWCSAAQSRVSAPLMDSLQPRRPAVRKTHHEQPGPVLDHGLDHQFQGALAKWHVHGTGVAERDRSRVRGGLRGQTDVTVTPAPGRPDPVQAATLAWEQCRDVIGFEPTSDKDSSFRRAKFGIDSFWMGMVVGIVVTAQIARAGNERRVGETLKEISEPTSGRGSHARG